MVRRIRFQPGQIVATPGALEALVEAQLSPLSVINRHLAGDWGEVDSHDAHENEIAIKHGYRIVSSYPIGKELRIWAITEADRSSTCLLLPSEY